MLRKQDVRFLREVYNLSTKEKNALSFAVGRLLAPRSTAWFAYLKASALAYGNEIDEIDEVLDALYQFIACVAAMHKGRNSISVREALRRTRHYHYEKGWEDFFEQKVLDLTRSRIESFGIIFEKILSLFGQEILSKIDVEELFEDLLEWNSEDADIPRKWTAMIWDTDDEDINDEI